MKFLAAMGCRKTAFISKRFFCSLWNVILFTKFSFDCS